MCLGLISAREAELAEALGLSRDERPGYSDEPATTQYAVRAPGQETELMAEAIASLISDSEGSVVSTGHVVVYAPKGRGRKRFPEGCVRVCASEAEARAAARPSKASTRPWPADPPILGGIPPLLSGALAGLSPFRARAGWCPRLLAPGPPAALKFQRKLPTMGLWHNPPRFLDL
jgi:hypothetical protein